jgi:hypothetical protein
MDAKASASTAIRVQDTLGFNNDVIFLKHFREHLAILSEPRLLELLSLANTMPVTNKDARVLLKVGRNGAYYWLGNLVRLGMLEKRGQTYRVSPYSMSLVAAASLTFRSLVSGKMPQVATTTTAVLPTTREDVAAWTTILQTASEGLELLYSRGRIDQSERARQQKMINVLRLELDDAPRA